MSLGMILFFITVALAVAVLPKWSYSKTWGYVPASVTAVVAVALFVLAYTGRI